MMSGHAMDKSSAAPGNYYQSPTPVPGEGHWTTGLCECFSDCSSCCLTCWCPCITYGRIAEIVDKGQSSCCASGCIYYLLMTVGFQWAFSCLNRSKLKMQYAMKKPSTCRDCCVHFWCESCALCQEYRELQNRGYDLSLGWEGNVARKNLGNGVADPPLMHRGMNR